MSFKRVIQRDSDVCNNCFRRVADTVEHNYFVTTYGDELWAKKVDRPDRRWNRPEATQHQAGDELTDGTVTGCVCGMRNMPLRPARQSRLMRMADRIADRMTESDYAVDRNVLRREVWRRATQPEWQGKQDELLGTATDIAHRTDCDDRRCDWGDCGSLEADGAVPAR